MTDDKKVGFDMPKPDFGLGQVTIGGDAEIVQEKNESDNEENK